MNAYAEKGHTADGNRALKKHEASDPRTHVADLREPAGRLPAPRSPGRPLSTLIVPNAVALTAPCSATSARWT